MWWASGPLLSCGWVVVIVERKKNHIAQHWEMQIHQFVSQRNHLHWYGLSLAQHSATHTPHKWVRGPSRFGRGPLGLLDMSPFCLADDVLILGKLVELLRDSCGTSGCLMDTRVSLGQSIKSMLQKPWDFIWTGNLLTVCSVFCLLSLSQARRC